jgi:tripeptide aminopeptidase
MPSSHLSIVKPRNPRHLAKAAVWSEHKMPKVDTDAVVDTFISAAKIWAPSGEEKEMADKMKSDFQRLGIDGLQVTVDDAGEKLGSNTGNVIIDIPASPNAPPDAKAIALSFHLDRVPVRAEGVPKDEPVQIEETKDGIIRSKGQRTNIAADDRSGYAAIKEAVRLIHDAKIPHGRLKVIGFIEEEPGLFGAKALDPKHLEGLDYGFEFDGGKVGNILRGNAGIRRFNAVVEGESAPSIHQRRGKSALLAGSSIISELENDELDRGQMLNISNFESGVRDGKDRAITNLVPDTAFIAGEVRGRTTEDEKALHAKIDSAFAQAAEKYGVNYKLSYHDMPGFTLDEGSDVVRFAEIATEAAGAKPRVITTRGGTDANEMNAKGLPTITLGAGGKAQHTVQESIHRNNLVRATQVAMSVIAATASPMVAAALTAQVPVLADGGADESPRAA